MLVVGAFMSTSKLTGGAGLEAGAADVAGAAGLSVLDADDCTVAGTGLPRR
jgi:hypothetical protein